MENLLKINQVSQILNISIKCIYKMIHYKQIPFYKIGARIRFREKELEIWLKNKKNE